MKLTRKNKLKFVKNQKGQGMVEYVLLLVVIIGLVMAFKKPIKEKFDQVTGKATDDMGAVIQ
jgi:Flp pilus assembly pilin Flp